MPNNPGNNIQDISLDVVYEFILNGKDDKAPADVLAYLEELDKVRAMNLRIDRYGSKQAIIKHLVSVDGYSPYLANKLYNNSIEYFYTDSTISKEAWMVKIAEDMERDINMAVMVAESTNDFAKVVDMRVKLRDTIIEAIPETNIFEDGMFDRPIKIYTLTPEDAGIPSANRTELKKWVAENLSDIPSLVIERIEIEAGIIPGQLLIDPKNDPRKI